MNEKFEETFFEEERGIKKYSAVNFGDTVISHNVHWTSVNNRILQIFFSSRTV